ncbi:MAG: hypothetical protein ACJ8R9_24925 [Steroidobacteraceae bacterium]
MGLVLVAFVVVAVAAIGFIVAAERPSLLIVMAGGLLTLGYLSLYFSWYILNEGSRGYVGVAPGPGVFAFIVGPVGIACLVAAMVMLTKAWSSPVQMFAPLALVPCLLAVAYTASVTPRAEDDDQDRVRKWVDALGIRNPADCSQAQFARDQPICRKIVARLPPESAESIHTRGLNWGRSHRIADRDECSRNNRNFPLFDHDPEFTSGCIETIAKNRHDFGVLLAESQRFVADDDCQGGDQASMTPEAVEGCKSVTKDIRIEEGRRWAEKNRMFTAFDCEHEMLERPDRADFVKGCQAYVQSASGDIGAHWAAENPLDDPSECHKNEHASAEFVRGCEQALQPLLKIRNDGQRWARLNHLSADAECVQSLTAGFKQHLYFVLGCQDTVRVVRACAKDPANPLCCKLAQPPSCR